MSRQGVLPIGRQEFNPLDHGLYDRLAVGYYIDSGAWRRAVAEGARVGTCRACGGALIPHSGEQVGSTWWYEATCESCGKAVAAPDGRVLLRSGRTSEQPSGWRDNRGATLKKARAS